MSFKLERLPAFGFFCHFSSISIQRKKSACFSITIKLRFLTVPTSKRFPFHLFLSIYDSSVQVYLCARVRFILYICKMSICAYKLTSRDITLSGIRIKIFLSPNTVPIHCLGFLHSFIYHGVSLDHSEVEKIFVFIINVKG